jgi:hypothetical protein
MQLKVDIEFDQLVEIVKKLPSEKLHKLKVAIDNTAKRKKRKSTLEKLLLNGPVATDKEIETITNNRTSINTWRTK